MPYYGLVDVGSNTVRLVVYAVPDDGKPSYVRSDFSTIVNDKIMAGLAAYVKDGTFTDAGIDKAASTIKSHLRHAAFFDCARVSVFATAVVRNARNCHEVVSALEERIGYPVDVIDGAEEARLGFLGAKSAARIDDGVMIDIGGGSTELTVVRQGTAGACTSIAQGSLSSYASMVSYVVPSPLEIEQMRSAFAARLAALNLPTYATPRLFGVGGSVRAAAKMLAALGNAKARPQTLSRLDAEEILRLCIDDPSRFAHTALRAAPERVHTLVPGCAILCETMEALGAQNVSVCRCGIREGYLIERMLGAEVGIPLA